MYYTNDSMYFFFSFHVEIQELEMHVYNRSAKSASKDATPSYNGNGYQIQPKQGRCNRLKELIIDLFKTKGFFPPQYDLDEFLVSLRFFYLPFLTYTVNQSLFAVTTLH